MFTVNSAKNQPACYYQIVGTPATFHIGSDRYAGSIVNVKRNGRTITFRFANSNREEDFTLRGGGTYYSKGSNCGYLSLGVAEDHRDPSF